MKKNRSGLVLFFADTILFAFSLYAAFLLRFDFNIPDIQIEWARPYWGYFLACIVIKVVVTWISGLYKSILDNAGIDILRKVVIAAAISNIICVLPIFFLRIPIPRSIPVLAAMLDITFLLVVRFSLVMFRVLIKNSSLNKKNRIKTLVVGGGVAGTMIVKELKSNMEINHYPIGIIDDDPNKLGKFISGVEVLGNREHIKEIVQSYDVEEIVITIPSARQNDIQQIIDACSDLEVKVKILPTVQELINSQIQYSLARDLHFEDLLGRTELDLNNDAISKLINDRCVLVTGAGGSIGSEIVRTVAKYSPKNVVLLDFYESGVYELRVQKKFKYPDLDFDIAICSIQEYDLLEEVFKKYKPDIVFHAAAHKHVPLMEQYPKQALRNNIIGTYNVVDLANKYKVERFVMISTDKAVNPTNVMGATKQFAEKVVNSYSKDSDTLFSVVRFGNVLGSNGSVIPLFRHQIEHGGPVTVTHKEVVRFFMTIPEAVSLVIEAVSMSAGGETFVLDMGKPVKMYELAQKLIRFYGYTPDKDIKIEITGLRPGEKLYEELLMQDESLKPTYNKSVFISDQRISDRNEIMKKLDEVRKLATAGTEDKIRVFLKENIDGYKNPSEDE